MVFRRLNERSQELAVSRKDDREVRGGMRYFDREFKFMGIRLVNEGRRSSAKGDYLFSLGRYGRDCAGKGENRVEMG